MLSIQMAKVLIMEEDNNTRVLIQPSRLMAAHKEWTHHNSLGSSSKAINRPNSNNQINIGSSNSNSNMVSSKIRTVVINKRRTHINHISNPINSHMELQVDKCHKGMDKVNRDMAVAEDRIITNPFMEMFLHLNSMDLRSRKMLQKRLEGENCLQVLLVRWENRPFTHISQDLDQLKITVFSEIRQPVKQKVMDLLCSKILLRQKLCFSGKERIM